MNEWQNLMQVRYRARAAAWPGGQKVWGDNVLVTAGPTEAAMVMLRTPFLLLRPGGGTQDPQGAGQEPGLISYRPVARLAQAVPGDGQGENALLGANRISENASGGHGLLELQEELFRLLRRLLEGDGVRIGLRAVSGTDATLVDGMGYVAFRDYEFELLATWERFYEPPLSLAATAIGGGQVSLTWKLPPDRFDRFRVRLRRAAGSTPPATITDGVEVALASNLDTSKTDTPGVGTFSYSIFATYDDRSAVPASDLQFSGPSSRTVLVT